MTADASTGASQIHAQECNQRQAQEAVGNGAACGTFLARAICINVDPLVISRACRELIMDWSTVTQWDLPRSWPMKSLIAASVTFGIAGVRCLDY